MDRKTKKKIAGGVALLLVTVLLAVMPLIAESRNTDGRTQSILSAAAVRGSVETRLYFAGAFSSGDTETVTLPVDVRVTKLLVSDGDVVHKGDALAIIDKVSVMSMISSLSAELKSIESEMYTLKYSLRDGEISVGEDGRIYVGGSAVYTDEYGYYAEFLSLVQTHREYEETLAELFGMYSSGALLSPCDGIVSGVDKSVVTKLSDGGVHGKIILLSSVTPAPSTPEPAEPTTPSGEFIVAKVIAVSNGIICLVYDPTPQTDLSAPVIDESKMTGMESIRGDYRVGDILLISDDGITLYRSADAGEGFPEGMGGGEGGESGGGGNGGMSGGGGAGEGSSDGSQSSDSFDMDAVTVMEIIPQSDMTVTLTVDESDISALRVGTKLDITAYALGSEKFSGTVSRIDSTAQNDGGSSKFSVDVDIDTTGDMLPGMNVCASLSVEQRDDCLYIPVAAVMEDFEGYYVYTSYSGDKLSEITRVELGVSDGENVEVVSGLSENDTVWYAYYDILEISNKAE